MMSWKTFLARAGAASGLFGVAMFVALRLAAASPGGPTRDELTYAGVLREVDGGLPTTARTTTLTFMFAKSGVPLCTVSVPGVVIAAGGAFTANVPIASCGSGYFDGSDITYEVAQGGELLTPDGGVHITPVPYARFADQAGVNNNCPAGYSRDTADMWITSAMRLCVRRRSDGTVYDEVVRVGVGGSAFWIDRYEASVWDREDASSRNFGAERDDYGDVGYLDNGQWGSVQLWALSKSGVRPSRYITWFQAAEACRSSGKRLATGEEWQVAARRTPDSGDNPGMSGRCVTNGTLRQTGQGHPMTGSPGCEGAWGVEDMIGNLWEWTGEWYASVGGITSLAPMTGVNPTVLGRQVNDQRDVWPAGYGADGTWNVSSAVYGAGPDTSALPSATRRGGSYANGEQAGVFALNLNTSPASSGADIGFRCVVPR